MMINANLFKRLDFRLLFLFYIITYFIISYFTTNLLGDRLQEYFLSEQLSKERILEILNAENKWQWLSYIMTPIILVIKILIVSFCIFVGLIFLEEKYSFKKILKIVLLAEGVFIISSLIKLLFFSLNQDKEFEYLMSYSPLSLNNLFDSFNNIPYLNTLLQQLNFFQLIYIFFISLGIKAVWNIRFIVSIKHVIFSYGICYLAWVVFIIYLDTTT